MGLDFRHVDELSADLFGKDDAFTLGARMVRRGEAFRRGTYLETSSLLAPKPPAALTTALAWIV